jgi:excisionase family DNA binding protein
MNEKTQKQLLNLKEACHFLNCKPSRLYYLVFKREIPFLKIGASLRFDPDSLESWLEMKAIPVKEVL